MKDNITITHKGMVREYKKGTVLKEISEDYKELYENDIILAMVDNKLRELNKQVKNDCEIKFITVSEDSGYKTYVRGLTLVMLRAAYKQIGAENLTKVCVEYAIGPGIYCEIEGRSLLTKELLVQIEAKMRELVERDLPFEKKSIGTDEAIALFEQYRMYDKQKLFKYRRVSKANIYNLDGFEDYFYGYMPPSTGLLKYFRLEIYNGGFMMQMPTMKHPREVEPFEEKPQLFQTLKESNQWGKTMGVDTVGALNDVIAAGNIKDLILVQEALQEEKIARIATEIAASHDKKFIMIAGPSSSGKTTFSHRLSIQLRTHGLNPHPIAVDDYFVNREDTPVDENGQYNYECLEAIDTKQFNEDMTKLLNGKTVELPSFNFKTGKREYNGNFKTMGAEDILVIEGIHGLNDKLSHSLPKESKYKIYISALTQLNIDEHNRIPTTDGRLIRRMVRDARTRGASAYRTIGMWSSVRRGEDEHIFPFQEDADVMFNSALIYELAILKQYAEPILFGIDRESPEYVEAKRLLKFLDYFIGVSSEDVPKNSMLREFIGDSVFHL